MLPNFQGESAFEEPAAVKLTPSADADVQQLYKQWQDGKLLSQEERLALEGVALPNTVAPSFADVLKSTTELDSSH